MFSMGISIRSHDFFKNSSSSIFVSKRTGFALSMGSKFIDLSWFFPWRSLLMLIFKLESMIHAIFLDNFTQWLTIFIGFSNVKWVHTFQLSLSAPFYLQLQTNEFLRKKLFMWQTNKWRGLDMFRCYTFIISWDFFFSFLHMNW